MQTNRCDRQTPHVHAEILPRHFTGTTWKYRKMFHIESAISTSPLDNIIPSTMTQKQDVTNHLHRGYLTRTCYKSIAACEPLIVENRSSALLTIRNFK